MEYKPLINYSQKPQQRVCWYAVGYVVFTVAVVALLVVGVIKRGVI